ncbi:MAG: DEAD/DEAH box helicase family protein, partial [Candidatus Nealsonbacteria bacterium]|nr:DEAD/DEAH box helicase family protein [Candidatus Nealsonbacteria bacterium]
MPAKVFSNGKSQENIVQEVVAEVKKGTKIVFIHGVCGSGKSAIALNIARELGKASIVVPIKNLQRQYESDYMSKKYLLKDNKNKLKISMITGRNNHICPYLADNTKEIFQKQSMLIPCKIEIKSRNLPMLKKYYTENPERKDNSELDINVAKRFAVAPACPYWGPILPSEMKLKNEWRKTEYNSVAGKHTLYFRKEGCPYYSQFAAYADADVIIFNGDQYILETEIGRKPLTDVEIIDECDEFLDKFALEGTINLNRLRNELQAVACPEESQRKLVDGLIDDITELFNESKEYATIQD